MGEIETVADAINLFTGPEWLRKHHLARYDRLGDRLIVWHPMDCAAVQTLRPLQECSTRNALHDRDRWSQTSQVAFLGVCADGWSIPIQIPNEQ